MGFMATMLAASLGAGMAVPLAGVNPGPSIHDGSPGTLRKRRGKARRQATKRPPVARHGAKLKPNRLHVSKRTRRKHRKARNGR